MIKTIPVLQAAIGMPTDARVPAPLQAGPGRQVCAQAPLPLGLDAELQFVGGSGPRIALYLSMPKAVGDQHGLTPLIVIHSVNAAASAAEVRPVFERYGPTRPVVAIDLPGFGQSERGALDYTPQMMTDAILRTVEHLQGIGFRRPADLMAISLSCEFAAQAALERPTWFRSVALISPTGLDCIWPKAYEAGLTKEKRLLRKVLETPWWSQALYRALTTRTSLRYFLQRAWGSVSIDQQLLEYNLHSAQHPGARHAPFAFISGALFTQGIAKLYARLPHPVWIAHGVRGDYTRVDALHHFTPSNNWVVEVFGTGALPFFEAPALFASRYGAFLRKTAALQDPPTWRSRFAPGAITVA